MKNEAFNLGIREAPVFMMSYKNNTTTHQVPFSAHWKDYLPKQSRDHLIEKLEEVLIKLKAEQKRLKAEDLKKKGLITDRYVKYINK